jgi:CelD/BcsL family acetyltransferase involved in cellulose biosynthesis
LRGDTHSPRFEQTPWEKVNWDGFASYPTSGPFQSRAWIEFLAEIQQAEPISAALIDGGQEVGRFTGLMVNKFGLRVLGSPLPGWTTPYMGFNLRDGVPARVAVRALMRLAFNDLGCVHLELRDRWIGESDMAGLGFGRRDDVGYDDRTFEIDLRRPEDAIFNDMASACRRCIRQAEKRGVTIEQARGESFADEFYPQIRDVFLRQGLVPTYGIDRVKALIRHLEPHGQILLLRARDADGRCIATGLYPAFNDVALFWGGASLKEHQHNRPNEALHWHAIRYWRERGIARYDLGGFMDYKRKYGGQEVLVPGFRRSRSPIVAVARSLAPSAMRAKQRVIARFGRVPMMSAPLIATTGDGD